MNVIRNVIPTSLRPIARKLSLRWQILRYGKFMYFGSNIYSPKNSIIFRMLLNDGIYERDVTEFITSLAKQNTTVIDVGANIGVLSAAILGCRPDINVISVECSPSNLPYLRKTIESSPYRSRWQLMENAASDCEHIATFYTRGDANGAFDGINDTGRGGASFAVTVAAMPLDSIWVDLGRPNVSMIKVDVEGGEAKVIRGASEIIRTCSPIIIFEWNAENIKAAGVEAQSIFEMTPGGYSLVTVPTLRSVQRSLLPLEMRKTEMFALLPNSH